MSSKWSVITQKWNNDIYSDIYKQCKVKTKTKSYSVPGGYPNACILDFSDVFQNTILGVVSVTKTGEGVVGAYADLPDAITINNVNRTITLPLYGGTGGIPRDVSGTITVTAIGY